MIDVDSEFAGDLQEIVDDWTDTFTWRGTNYRCLADRQFKESESQFGGTVLTFSLEIYCQKSLFTDGFPGTKQTLDFSGINWTIVSKQESPDGLQLRFSCVRT